MCLSSSACCCCLLPGINAAVHPGHGLTCHGGQAGVMMQCTVCWHDQCEPTGDSCPEARAAAWKQASSGGPSPLSILSCPLNPHRLLPHSFPFGLFALKGWRALSLGCQCCLHCCRFATSNRTKRISNCTGITAPSHALFCPAPWSVMQLQDALVPLFVCVVSKSSDFLTSLPHKLDKSAMSLTVYCHGSFQ